MKFLARSSVAVILATSLSAPLAAAPVTYTVDGSHTFPRFSYSHLGLSTQSSQFTRTEGSVTFDAEAQTGVVEISIDMTSVETGFPVFNEHIQDVDFFDTASHPTATFKSTAVRFDGDRPVAVDGDLTIKGITQPVTLEITHFQTMPHPMVEKPALGANATTQIKRSDFNLGKYAPYVSDEVTIDIAIEAIAQ